MDEINYAGIFPDAFINGMKIILIDPEADVANHAAYQERVNDEWNRWVLKQWENGRLQKCKLEFQLDDAPLTLKTWKKLKVKIGKISKLEF